MPLIYRNNLSRALTWEEADGNLKYLSTTMSGSNINITGSTIILTGSVYFQSTLVQFTNLPTSSVGLTTGTIWNSGSFIKIV
jgi:hypothetical protein